MVNKYHRLSFEGQEEISRGLSQGNSLRNIARKLGRHPSTINREIYGGSGNRYVYRAVRAQKQAQRKASRRRGRQNKLVNHDRLRQVVLKKLRLRWSLEQIAYFLKMHYPDDKSMKISHETIYAYLYILPRGELKKELIACLRQGRKHRRRRNRLNKPGIERKIEDMISIEERLKEVVDRTVPGHWEGDLFIGKNRRSALDSLVERTSHTTRRFLFSCSKAVQQRK